jgi:hypothetical protein
LQPDQHDPDRRRRVEVEPAIRRARSAAEHLDQMVVDDLDHHLRRRHRAQHLLPQRLLAHRGDKVADHRQRHIGFEQRHPNLAQCGADIAFVERAMPAQPVEHVAEAIAQAVEHTGSRCSPADKKRQCATLADWRPPVGGFRSPRKRGHTLAAAGYRVNSKRGIGDVRRFVSGL